jgi:hypothetical protein
VNGMQEESEIGSKLNIIKLLVLISFLLYMIVVFPVLFFVFHFS